MEQRNVIIDRLCLLADILCDGPDGIETALFSALDGAEEAALLTLLEKLTDRAEAVFTAGQQAQPMPEASEAELGERELLCRECELFCRVAWDEAGAVTGARCQMGYQAALERIDGEAK